MKKFNPLILLIALSIACNSLFERENITKRQLISKESLKKHLITLSSNEYQGRKPFTEGEARTINYLKRQFEQFELKPGNGDAYFQDVPLVELNAKPSETMIIRGNDQSQDLIALDEFVAYTERVEEFVSLENTELVFAGYGVVAPEYGWNDYEELDVKGKMVIVLINDPGFASDDSTFFRGETMTYYSRWTYKYEEAARQGAAGCLIVHETIPAGYPWLVVRNSWSGASLYLDTSGNNYQPAILGWITRNAAIKIFETSRKNLKNFAERARQNDFQAIDLKLTVSVSVETKSKKMFQKM
ncbi:MAG: hypothetical protein AAF600_08170 [Bacteroidota bacterium]